MECHSLTTDLDRPYVVYYLIYLKSTKIISVIVRIQYTIKHLVIAIKIHKRK